MNVEIFTLCESATVDDGAVSVHRTKELSPLEGRESVMAELTLVCVLRFFPDEEGHHTMRVRFEDADGQSVFEAQAKPFVIDLQAMKYDSWRFIQKFSFNFELRRGEHRCTLFVDDREKISIPYYVE